MKFETETNYTLQKEFFTSNDRILISYGGANAGKTYSAADKKLLRVINEERNGNGIKIITIRKTLPSIRRSNVEIDEKEFNKFGVRYEINRAELSGKIGNKSKILYLSMNSQNDYQKIKSITDVDYIHIEEANEITEEAFQLIKMRLRGGQAKYKQLLLTFNPANINSWIYDYFFVKKSEQAKILKYTVDNNKYAQESDIKVLDDLKDQNNELYKVYRLGEWGTLSESIYQNLIYYDKYQNYDYFIGGVDFGYNDPSVFLLIGIKDSEYFILDEVYESKLLNNHFIERILELLKNHKIEKKINLYCDSAEPDRIQEFCNSGLNAYPAEKDVKEGIRFCQTGKIYINTKCVKTIKDFQAYSWKRDKDGRLIDDPAHFGSHAPDAFRYAKYTHDGIGKPKIYMV